MRSLMGPNVVLPPRVLRKLFLDQMPCETRKMLSIHDNEDLDGLAKMADRIHENDSRVSRTAASSAGHFSHVTKTPMTSLSLDSVSDKLNDLSVCVERLNATVSNLSRSHPTSHNSFSPQHFSTLKRDSEFFRSPRNFCNSSQTNFQGPAAHATYSKTPNRNQTSKDVSFRSENELNKPNSDLRFYHARFGASARSCWQPCNWRGSQRSLFRNPRDKPVGLMNANLGVWMVLYSRSAGDKRLTGHMTAANGTLVPTYETFPLTVTFGLQKSCKWNFLPAGVSCAILGLDFLTHFGFVLDLANKTLQLPCHDKVDAKLTRPRCGSAIKEPDVSIAEAVERVDISFSSENGDISERCCFGPQVLSRTAS